MKHNKLPSVIALSISLELVLSPLPAFANNGAQVLNTLQFATGLYGTVRNGAGQMPSHVSSDMTALQQQQTPIPDKHFSLEKLQKIPGLMEYIAIENQKGNPINPAALNCQTLPTTLYEANNEVCRDKEVSGIKGNPQLQADEAFAYYNQYMQIDKLYSNYSVDSNAGGQAYGIGCMNDAKKILEGFFNYRLTEMEKVVERLEAATAEFEKQSTKDLLAIKEASAILNGENSRYASDFKDSEIFDYGKRFEDPACTSILAKDKFGELGKRGGGLIGIDAELTKTLNNPVGGSTMSPKRYMDEHASIEQDIKKMADKVATQANLNFSQISSGGYSNFLSTLSSDVSSETGVNSLLNKSFFADLQQKFSVSNKRLTDEARLISAELGGRGGEALSQLANIDNDSPFDAELNSLENRIKGECVNKSGIDEALGRIYDPNLSKEANKHSANQIRKRIKAIIADVNRSPEEKLKELSAIDGVNNGRFQLKMDDGYEVSKVGADGKVSTQKKSADGNTPYAYLKDVMTTCESQFQVNKLGNKLSAKEAIKRLRSLKQDYKKAARQHSNDIKNEIIKKMINCGGNNEVANSSTVGSCNAGKVNPQAAGFCSKAAFSCAKNLQTCTDKAQKFVKEIKNDRSKRITNYNQNVEKNRDQLLSIFDRAMFMYEKESDSLRANFGVGFTRVTGVNRNLTGDLDLSKEYAGDPGDELKIKDPKAYLKMVKDNFTKLRANVEEQQKAIIGPSGPIAGHIKQTQDNYKNQVLSKAKKLASDCLAAYNSYGAMMKGQKEATDKAMGELGEKNGALCSMYNRIMSDNPNGACKEDITSTGTSALLAASKSGGNTAEINYMIQEMEARCANLPQESSSAAEICGTEVPETFKEKFGAGKSYSFDDACKVITDPKANATLTEKICDSEPTLTTYTKTTKPGSTPPAAGDPVDKKPGEECDGKWSEKESTTESITWYQKCSKKAAKADCDAVGDALVAAYKISLKKGDLYVNSAAVSSSTPGTCAASFNGGPHNFKGGYGQQNGMQNPLGPMGFQQ